MQPQLLLVKRLFLESQNFAERGDAVSAGLAISLMQDAVELYVWTVIKEKGIVVKDGDGFVPNLESLQKAGIAMPFKARLLELNRARVNFKHYGNLPDPTEAQKHAAYVEDALRMAMQSHFSVEIESLSLADLVSDEATRASLKLAEGLIFRSKFDEASVELSKAKSLTLDTLSPQPFGSRLDLVNADRLLSDLSGSHFHTFSYLENYIDDLKNMSIMTMLQISAADFSLINRRLPHAMRATNGAWHISSSQPETTESECRRALVCISNLAIRLQARQ
jgi:hypothetical protein